jgi:hypothetical protein
MNPVGEGGNQFAQLFEKMPSKAFVFTGGIVVILVVASLDRVPSFCWELAALYISLLL